MGADGPGPARAPSQWSVSGGAALRAPNAPRLTCQLRNRPALLVSIAQSTGTRSRPIGCFLLVLKIRPHIGAKSPALIGSGDSGDRGTCGARKTRRTAELAGR